MSRMIYFCSDLEAETPVLVGSGNSNYSDQDIIRGSDGLPFIPGSTLAGVCRNYLSCVADEKRRDDLSSIDYFFGKNDKDQDQDQEKGIESKFVFYDAFLNGAYHLALRDGVRIGENGVAEDGGKFNFEILRQGCIFRFRTAVLVETEEEENTITRLLTAIEYGIQKGEIKIGGKTSRGYGKFRMKNAKILALNLDKEFDQFLAFQWEDVKEGFQGDGKKQEALFETLHWPFSIQGFLMISNTASLAVGQTGEHVMAEQLHDGTTGNPKPVIPGTSWAGVFRHHFLRLLQECDYTDPETLVKDVFGFVDETTKAAAVSKIQFSESVIDKTHMMNRTRNAVDRFTGGACDKKLYTVRPAYGGQGVLEIRLAKNIPHKELVHSLLCVCMKDFNDGFLSVGGDSGVGGGIIRFEMGGEVECKRSIQQ